MLMLNIDLKKDASAEGENLLYGNKVYFKSWLGSDKTMRLWSGTILCSLRLDQQDWIIETDPNLLSLESIKKLCKLVLENRIPW